MSRRPLLVIDAETDPFQFGRIPVPFVWGRFDGRSFDYYWGETDRFMGRLLREPSIAFAHNGGRFDFHYLWDWLPSGTKIRPLQGRVASVRVPGGLELRDSLLIFPYSMRRYEKQRFDYALCRRENRNRYRAEILQYLYDDCRNQLAVVRAFVDRFGLRPLTVAGASLAELRRIQGVATTRTAERWDSIFRGYFYGGRCEAWRTGSFPTDVSAFDINSAYPAAMVAEHPWGRRYLEGRSLPEDPGRLARAFVRFEGRSRGALPMRDGRQVTYPDTSGEFAVTGHELLAGIETGDVTIDRVLCVKELRETISFEPFVSEWWAERERSKASGDVARELIAKAILNGLYGKLAQDDRTRRSFQLADLIDLEPLFRSGWNVAGECGRRALVSRPAPKLYPSFLNVATAASITGAVRARLWTVARRSAGVLYMDTDSIVCRALDPLEPIGDALGEWGTEGPFDHASIGGRKLYAFRRADGSGHKYASKGVRLSPHLIEQVARGAIVRYDPEAPTYSLGGVPRFESRTIRLTKGMRAWRGKATNE